MKKKPETYRFGKGMRIFLISLCLILLASFVGGPMAYWLEDTSNTFALYLLIIMSALFVPLFVFAVIDLVKWEVSISMGQVTVKNSTGIKTFRFDDVVSYKRGQNFLKIYLKSSDRKPIRIWVNNPGSYDVWYLLTQLEDVRSKDEIEKQRQYTELDKKYNYGLAKGDRGRKKLKQARRVTKVLNTVAIVAAIILMIDQTYYGVTMMICLFVVLCMLVCVLLYDGLIQFFDYTEGDTGRPIYASAGIGLIVLSFVMYLKVNLRIDVLNFEAFWTPFGIVASTLVILCVFGSKLYSMKKWADVGTLFIIVASSAAISYAALLYINEALDVSKVEAYELKIEDKKEYRGNKNTTYSLYSNQKPVQGLSQKYDVPKKLYDEKQIGDTFYILVRKGTLDISYYTIQGNLPHDSR